VGKFETAASLSNMSTHWDFIFQSHSPTPDEAHVAACQLMCRYAGAVHRYLLKALKDPDVADELDQEFAVRFLRGDFGNYDRNSGRFRDFVKRALKTLINDYCRRKRTTLSSDARAPELAAEHSGDAQFDQQFLESWRKDLLERAWDALAEVEKRTGRPYHTVLRSKVANPGHSSSAMADELSTKLEKHVSAGAVRQILHRSREEYVDYLLTEVRASLDNPTRDEIEQELSDLNLLHYCRPFMKPRDASSPDELTTPKPKETSEVGITSSGGSERPVGSMTAAECPSTPVGPVGEPGAAGTSLLDRIIGAWHGIGRSSAVAEALAESLSVDDFVLAFVESTNYDPGVARSKIEDALHKIDVAMGRTDGAADLRALSEARERLQGLQERLAKLEGSVSLSASIDKILIDDTVIRERFLAEANETTVLGHPELVPVQPVTIRRHTDVSFPAEVQAGKVYNLRVQLVPAAEILPSGEVCERPKPHAHDATLNLLVAPPPTPDTSPPPVEVTVSLAAENFEVEGPARAEIIVHLEGASSAVQFGLRGLAIGLGRIMIDFAQTGRPAGSVDLAPVIVGSGSAVRHADGLAPASLELSIDLDAGPARASPDVVLKVFEHRLAGHPGRLQFVLSSSHPALADLPVLDGDLGTLDLRTDVANWVGEQLRVVGSLAESAEASAADVERTLASVGFNLFEHLLPPAVQEMSWTLRQRGVKTLMVLSDDPHIPWELVKPFRANPVTGEIISEDGFWGESYALAHWLRGRPPIPRLTIARVVGCAASWNESVPGPRCGPEPISSEFRLVSNRDMVRINTASTGTGSLLGFGDMGTGRNVPDTPAEPPGLVLDAAALDPIITSDESRRGQEYAAAFDEELGFLRALEALGARVERLPALRQALRQAFSEGSFDLLHLVSHGTFGGTAAGDATAVYLDDGMFTAAELSPLMAGALRRAAPLVIFNTCHCGRMGFSLTRLGSWGAHLVRLGCGAFIGALWPVSDRAALAFARAFYE
jgi:CHAT domain